MRKEKRIILRTLSYLSFALGILFLFNSFNGITGFVVAEGIDVGLSYSYSLLLFVVGFVLLSLAERVEESALIDIINRTVIPERRETALVLPDTSFLKDLYSSSKEISRGFFGFYRTWLTDRVVRESQRKSRRTNQPLVPKRIINFIRSMEKMREKEYIPPESTIETIYEAWRNQTNKGRKANIEEQRRFRESADMQLLSLAYDRAQSGDYTIILSADSEFRELARHLNRRVFGKDYIGIIEPDEILK